MKIHPLIQALLFVVGTAIPAILAYQPLFNVSPMEFLHHTELIIYPLMFGYIIYQLALINQKLTTAEKIRELQRKAVNTENVNMAKTMLLFSKWVDSQFDSFANTINSSMGKKVIVRKRDDHKTEVLDELGKLMKEKVSDINTEIDNLKK